MKLATMKNGTRDGKLYVVSRNLEIAVAAPENIGTLQQAIDDWKNTSVLLEELYSALNDRSIEGVIDFSQSNCMSPLPRAYQWADGSAYVNHVELVRKARNADMPESFWVDPLMYQGGSDSFIGPRDDIIMASEEYGIDMEAEVAVIVDDLPMAANTKDALASIILLMTVNDVSLRNLIPGELSKGFGFFQSKPSSAFSPVAITPDELGEAWHDGKVHLPLVTHLNEQLLGNPDAGVDMTFDFPTLIAHAAKTRPLAAGAIIGSGTISNKAEGTGSSCLAEVRMLEIIADGKATTPFMSFGDQVRIEMFDKSDLSLFGAINQTIVQYDRE